MKCGNIRARKWQNNCVDNDTMDDIRENENATGKWMNESVGAMEIQIFWWSVNENEQIKIHHITSHGTAWHHTQTVTTTQCACIYMGNNDGCSECFSILVFRVKYKEMENSIIYQQYHRFKSNFDCFPRVTLSMIHSNARSHSLSLSLCSCVRAYVLLVVSVTLSLAPLAWQSFKQAEESKDYNLINNLLNGWEILVSFGSSIYFTINNINCSIFNSPNLSLITYLYWKCRFSPRWQTNQQNRKQ